MLALRGMAWLLALQSIGELMARGLSLPFPGPVVGMVLLLLALRWPLVRAPVAASADFLLSHLSLLFVPVGVGVMTHLGLIGTYGVRILVALVLSTWIGLAVTAWVLRAKRPRGLSDQPAACNPGHHGLHGQPGAQGHERKVSGAAESSGARGLDSEG